MKKVNFKEFFIQYKIWLLILLLISANYLAFKYYTSGTFINYSPITVINVVIILLWTIIHINVSSYKDKTNGILIKALVFILICFGCYSLLSPNINNEDLDDLVKIQFDNKSVQFYSDIPFSPVSHDREVHLTTEYNDPYVIFDYDGSSKLLLKNNRYYKSGMRAPFSGVYYLIDREKVEVKEASSYLLGEIMRKKIYDNNLLVKDIYYRRSTDGLGWGNSRFYEINYNHDNNKETTIEYNRDGEKTGELIYLNDTKVKEIIYEEGLVAQIKVFDEYVECYYETGKTRFRGTMHGANLWGDVLAYYKNGQTRYEGEFSQVPYSKIWTTIGREDNYSPEYKLNLILLSDQNYEWVKSNPGIIEKSDYDYKGIVYDDSWYLQQEKTPDGYLIKVNSQGNMHGDWIYYYNNGVKQAEGSYYLGFPVKDWVYYHENGQTEAKGNYVKPGIKGGYWEYYYDNGQLKSSGGFATLDDSELKYIKAFYVTPRSSIINMSLKNGLWEYYSRSGALMARGRYLNGEKVGSWEIREDDSGSFRKEEHREIDSELLGELIEIQGEGDVEVNISGDEVRLKAVPAENWTFHKWGGGLEGSSETIVTNLEEDVIAYFDYNIEHDKPGENGYSFAVTQDGEKIPIIDNEVYLEKEPFEYDISFVGEDEFLLYIQASLDDKFSRKIDKGLKFEDVKISNGYCKALSTGYRGIYLEENVTDESRLQSDFYSFYPISYTRERTHFDEVIDIPSYKIGKMKVEYIGITDQSSGDIVEVPIELFEEDVIYLNLYYKDLRSVDYLKIIFN
ncbi:MAG: toxin-antitoxin system YwqK family antitoxin [bacterium]